MRKLLIPLVALGAFALAIGCHHVAGICDCDGPRDHCRFNDVGSGSVVEHGPAIIPVPAKTAEPIKEAPKAK